MRNSIAGTFVVLASVLLGSCGGGGAGSDGPRGGPPQILPETGTMYGGVTYTFTVGGGRPPYFLTSTEPQLAPVPERIEGFNFTVTPANPGVYDQGLPDDALPVRSVIFRMRDAIGNTAATGNILVAINFMTGYGVSYTSTCAASGTSAAPPQACAGGDTLVTLNATINGNLHGNREYRFEVVRGPFSWLFPSGQQQGGTIAGNTVTTRTDHEGDARVMFRVNPGVATQLGVFRVVDVLTGASVNHVFTINGLNTAGPLTVIPSEFSFTGATTAQCGTGSADFFVFDGRPPYTAVSSTPNVIVTPDPDDPSRFRLAATNPFICLSDATVIITDANGQRATVTVTTEAGSADPPPTPVTVTPGQISLACGTSGSVSILGGSTGTGGGGGGSTFSVSSSDARVTATVSGRTITVGRTSTDPPGTPVSPTPGTPNPIGYQVTVTDGATSTVLTVSAPSNCPP
jgi:hypothetical protein